MTWSWRIMTSTIHFSLIFHSFFMPSEFPRPRFWSRWSGALANGRNGSGSRWAAQAETVGAAALGCPKKGGSWLQEDPKTSSWTFVWIEFVLSNWLIIKPFFLFERRIFCWRPEFWGIHTHVIRLVVAHHDENPFWFGLDCHRRDKNHKTAMMRRCNKMLEPKPTSVNMTWVIMCFAGLYPQLPTARTGWQKYCHAILGKSEQWKAILPMAILMPRAGPAVQWHSAKHVDVPW